jgi:rhodanese-related sulfurtransferase
MDFPRVQIVDTRQKSIFDAFHVDGAMNFSAAELARKDYLKDMNVMLMDSGKSDRELYQECGRLKQNGFKFVKVVQGGMLSWLVEGEPVIGQAPAIPQSRQLAPIELLREREFSGSLFVLRPEGSSLSKYLDGTSRLSLLKSGGASGEVVRWLRQKNQKIVSIVLIGNGSDLYPQAADIQAKTGLPVFVYADGAAAYEKALGQQKALLVSKERPPRQAKCAL